MHHCIRLITLNYFFKVKDYREKEALRPVSIIFEKSRQLFNLARLLTVYEKDKYRTVLDCLEMERLFGRADLAVNDILILIIYFK